MGNPMHYTPHTATVMFTEHEGKTEVSIEIGMPYSQITNCPICGAEVDEDNVGDYEEIKGEHIRHTPFKCHDKGHYTCRTERWPIEMKDDGKCSIAIMITMPVPEPNQKPKEA